MDGKLVEKCKLFRTRQNLSINLNFSWPRGPILWGTASYMQSFGLAKYEPDRPSGMLTINCGNCEKQKNDEHQYKFDRKSNKNCKIQEINTIILN